MFRTTRYVALFALIQIVNVPLFLLGLPVVGILSVLRLWVAKPQTRPTNHFVGPINWAWRGGWVTWVWGNEEDGVFGPPTDTHVFPPQTPAQAFYWSAIRNPVNNLRFVPGVSGIGRPLWIKPYLGGYLIAGWRSDGWPVFHPYTKTLT